jgi:hypothetical protein
MAHQNENPYVIPFTVILNDYEYCTELVQYNWSSASETAEFVSFGI